MGERARAVLLGLGLGLAPLLLLDLARILGDAVASGDTSQWWPVACYLGAGGVAAVGVAAGRRDRLVPGVGAAVLLVAVLPTVPVDLGESLPSWPVVPSAGAAQAVALAVAGAYVYATVRGQRA